jgi:hypothetical protein
VSAIVSTSLIRTLLISGTALGKTLDFLYRLRRNQVTPQDKWPEKAWDHGKEAVKDRVAAISKLYSFEMNERLF